MLPSTQDYKIALMIGADSFRTLENVEVVMNPLYPEEPWYSTGGLAIVFKIKLNGKAYALKCFHKESPERQFRLRRIANYIKQNPSPFWVEFDYLENELWVETNGEGQGYPVVLMEWIEGKTLDNYLEELCNYETAEFPPRNKRALQYLYFHFCDLSEWLLFEPVAHGDLKHDNIIVMPSGRLKLIDYDGMFIPEFEGKEATELGSPCYQHPERTKAYFNDRLDEFSILAILTTLYAVYDAPELFGEHYNGDGILFSDRDFRELNVSPLFLRLRSSEDEQLNAFVKCFQRFQNVDVPVELMPIFQNPDWHCWKKKKAEIRYNEEIILRELLIRTKGWEVYEKILRFKNTGFDKNSCLPEWIKILCDWNTLSCDHHFIWSEYWIDLNYEKWNWSGLSSNSSISWSQSLIENNKSHLEWKWLSANTSIFWSEELIDFYQTCWNWEMLSKNPSLPWSIQLIKKYKRYWNWVHLSDNQGIKWSVELFEEFREDWIWWRLSGNPSVSWSINLIEKFKKEIFFHDLWINSGLPWSRQFIEEYKEQWDWEKISSNPSFPWTERFIEEHKNKLKWTSLSGNPSLPWDNEFIEKYKTYWSWRKLSKNESVNWSISLIEKFKDKWNWEMLSDNEYIPWSNKLIEDYKYDWDWQKLSSVHSLPWTIELIDAYSDKWDWKGLSWNKMLPWSESLIEKYKENWDWKGLSWNRSFPWSMQLIEKYEYKWDWYYLSSNHWIPWTSKLINHFRSRWNWERLSFNQSIPFSKYLIKEQRDNWNWKALSRNSSIPWTVELIEEFSELWDWNVLSSNYGGSSLEIYSGGERLIILCEFHFSRGRILPWSKQFIYKYQEKWNWEALSGNRSIPWTKELIEEFNHRINLKKIPNNISRKLL